MRAFLVQLSGLVVLIGGGFLVSVGHGVAAAGVGLVFVGLAVEGES